MIHIQPVVLEGRGVRLEPMTADHAPALAQAAADGRLWELWYTSVPEPEAAAGFVAAALKGLQDGHMLPWAVRDLGSDIIVGTTRFHDIVAAIDRVEIGYTFYARSLWRTSLNTTCKLLLLEHAFDTLKCAVVGLRTDLFNQRSQRAIEGLGARKDGVIRHFNARRDGTPRDTVMYSILAAEWPEVRRHLELRLRREGQRSEVPDA